MLQLGRQCNATCLRLTEAKTVAVIVAAVIHKYHIDCVPSYPTLTERQGQSSYSHQLS